MFMGMIIAIICYYTIVVRQEKVIPIAKITNCIYTTFPTIVLCFAYK